MTTPLPKPFSHPDCEKNQNKSHRGAHGACCLCYAPVRSKPGGYLRVVEGGARFADPTEPEDTNDDLGLWPIGSGCLRKHPELRPLLIPPTVAKS